MEDREIVGLYWDRDERAIAVTEEKYGAYCRRIARDILGDGGDWEECVNDTYLRAWNSMPTHRPERLGTYLARITRNLSFNRYRDGRTAKRGGGEMDLVLDELSECVPGGDVEQEFELAELVREIGDFLRTLPRRRRNMFLRRYWYAQPAAEIAKGMGLSAGSVAKSLERTRKQLRRYLSERGYDL